VIPRSSVWLARKVGTEAKRLAASPGFSGRILAVLSTTTYVLGGSDEILWLAKEGEPLHRRCILVSFPPDSFSAGQSFFVQGSCLETSGGAAIDLGQAGEWVPPVIGPGKVAPLETVNACVQRLSADLPRPASDEGLGQAIAPISGMPLRWNPVAPLRTPLLMRALNPILGVARGCLGSDMNEIVQSGRDLVGLGPGLTPSGDDFLGGVLFAARSLKTAYPGLFDWEEQPITDLIFWARTQTHPISHAILGDLARGYGVQPLHDVVTSLLSGEDQDRVMAGVTRLLDIGHTSGWDSLAGMLTGMLMVKGKLN